MVMRLENFKEEQVPLSLPWRYKAFTLRRVERESMPSLFDGNAPSSSRIDALASY